MADPAADELSPATPARKAVGILLRRQLEILKAQETGVVEDRDPENLHDFRVAIRRTRSLLYFSREVLGKRNVRRFRRRFGILGRQSGRRRDLDVQLADLAALAAAQTDSDRRALRPVEAWLRSRRNLAHHNLRRLLAGTRYRSFLQEWNGFLDGTHDAPATAGLPAGDLVRQAIRDAWECVCGEGKAIGNHSPPADLHELRKSAKRLRYALEFFRPLLGKDAARALIGDLKQLQDHLGAFQDCRVQLGTLQNAELDLLARNRLGADTALALVRLRAALLQREAELRRHFAEHFDRFPCGQISKHVQTMLEARATGNS